MRLARRNRKRWLALIRALREAYPPPIPTTIRTTRLSNDYYGITEYRDKPPHHLIKINSSLPYRERVEFLVHEYAHVLDHSERHLQDNCELHDDTWGIWYARCYRIAQELLA